MEGTLRSHLKAIEVDQPWHFIGCKLTGCILHRGGEDLFSFAGF